MKTTSSLINHLPVTSPEETHPTVSVADTPGVIYNKENKNYGKKIAKREKGTYVQGYVCRQGTAVSCLGRHEGNPEEWPPGFSAADRSLPDGHANPAEGEQAEPPDSPREKSLQAGHPPHMGRVG